MTDDFTCPTCGADLQAQRGFDPSKGYWTCADCGQQLFGDEEERESMTRRFPGVVWHCDNCDAVLNDQDGFTDWRPKWTCTECGRVNCIEEDEIVAGPVERLFRQLGFRGIEDGGRSGQEHL